MGKRLRKIISILLVIVMIIGMCPNSVVLAKESMDSGMTATSTDAEEGITEDSNTEESDPFIESEKSDTSTETDIQIDEETYPAFNPEPVIIDGVRISVSAAEGVFPEGASLSVAKVSNAELGAVEEALDVERDETEKVAVSYTYDIKVFDKDGNELQPEEGADVKVSFSMDAVANENLETNVYHISEDASGSLSADILPTEEDGTTVSASTDGFSYYTVEFTYDEKQYVMQGDSNVALVDILSFVGITKADGNAAESSDISAVSISNEELFSASNESGEWIVTANQAFTSTEWMKVTVDGVEYEIVVTDALQYKITVTESSIGTNVVGRYIPDTVDHIEISIHKDNYNTSVYLASGRINGSTGTVTFNVNEPANYITIVVYGSAFSNGVLLWQLKSSDEFTTVGTVAHVKYNATLPSVNPTYTAPTSKTMQYNGSAQDLVNAGSVSAGGSMEYAIGTSATTAPSSGWSASVPTDTNVGTYYVWYRINAANGYNAVAAKCVTSTISKADNPIAYANQTWNYTFSTTNQTKTLAQATNNQGDVTYSLQSQKSGTTNVNYFSFASTTRVLTANANTPAGTYSVVVRATAAGNTNYKSGTKDSTVTVTIGKTSSSATAPIAANKTYNGSAQTIAAGGSASGGTIYYGLGSSTTSGPSSSSWSTTLPSATNAGDYYIWYKVTGDSNHNDVAATYAAKATISKRTVTPTAPTLTTGTLTYDGTDKTLANAGSTTAGGTMYYYVSTSSTTPTFSISTWKQSIDTKTDAGTYYIFWYDYVSDTANNNDTTTDKINSVQSLGSRTIGNATITVNAPNQSYTYTSNPQGTAITATSVNLQTVTIKYGTVSGTYDLTTAPTATNVADSKTIYYQVTAPNHTTKTGSYTLTITKANASVTAPAANTLTYNGSAQALVTAGSTADGTLQYKLGTGGTYSSDIPTATNAGTYTVYYKVVGDANHNDIAEASLEVTIGPKSITPAANLGLADKYPAGAFPEVTIYDDDLHVAVPSSEYIISYSNINNPGEDATVTVSDRNGGNYTVETTTHTYTVENGIPTVTVAPRSVGSIEYNGAAQQLLANGGTALHGTVYYAVTTTATKPETSAYTITDPDAITGTEVGTYYIWYMVKGDTGYNDLYADGDGAYDYATITKKDITITAASASKNYDSTPLTSNNYTITSGELATGDEITDITITGTQTEAGNSNNVASGAVIMHGDTVVTSSYNITYAIGTLTVNRKAVTITADDGEWTYDGTSHSVGAFTVTGMSGDDEHEFTVTMTTGSKITDAGTSSNVIYSVDGVLMTTGTAKNIGNYTVTTADGTLTVNKADSSITTAPVAKTLIYNGSAQELVDDSDAHFSGGTLQYRVGTTGDYSDDIPERTYAGTYTVYYRLAGDSNHNDSEGGSFEVTIQQKTVKVSGITASDKIYDGTVAATLVYTGTSFDGIVEGDTLSVTATGTFAAAEGDPGFKVGEGKTVNISALALGGASVSNYVLAATGQQETATADITKKALTITADSDEKVYDGTALTKDSYTSTAHVTDDVIESVTVTGSQTVVGSSDNVPSNAVIKHGATDVSDCYDITYVNGTLTVTKKVVTITADSDTKVYDGTALTKNSYTNTDLGTGDSIDSVTITGSQTVVGTSENVPSNAVIKNADNEDVTASYTITYENGTLEVTKKAVTITADSGTKVYDGTALTRHTYTNTDLAEGDTIESVTFTGSQTVVGTSNNVPSNAVIKNSAGENVTSSYDITYANGTLTVTKKTLTITADSDTKVYDGTVLTKNSYTNTALGSGDTIESVTVTGSQTAAGSSDNVPSTAVIKHGDTDVTSSYEITYANGTLTVTAKPVTITAGSDSKIYDGTALTKNTYTNTELAEDETITSVTVTGSQTNVGESNNVPSAAVIKHDETDVTANYDITYVNGTLTVNAKTVTVTADNKSKGYGEADPEFTATVAGLVGTDTVNYTLSRAVGEDIGEYTITAAGAATQGNYSITYETGKLTIGKATLTITAEEKEKTYGEDDPALTYAVSGLKNGDTEDIVTGALARSAGEDVGTYAINRGTISAGDNYNINYVGANLTINRKVVTVKANDKSKTYGEADPTFTATVTGMANGELASEKLSYTITRTAGENVGTYTITPSGDAEQGNYSITYVNGTLEVTAKPLTITAGSDTKVFDGTALTKNSYTNTALADGDEIESVTVTGSQTNVGNSDNAPRAAVIKNAADDDVTDNYDITYVNGTLTVTAKSVTVKADNKSKVYGDNEPALTATVTGLVGTDSINYNLLRVAGEDIGEYTITPSGDAVQGNYTVTYETGKLTITKATLTITADAQEKTYGEDDPELTYTVDGLKNGDAEEIVTGDLEREDGENVGIYAIGHGTVSAGNNYNINYMGANLTINRKEVTVKANDKAKTYGSPDPAYDATVTGMVSGENASELLRYSFSREVGDTAGTYTITPSGATVQGNYFVTYETGTLTIGKKTVTVTAKDKTITYGDTPANEGVEYSGFVYGQDEAVLAGDLSYTYSYAQYGNAGDYTITPSGLSSDDYEISFVDGTLTVEQKEVGIEWGETSFTYDGESHVPTATATGLVNNDAVTITVTGARTVAGTGYTATAAELTGTKAGNYKLPEDKTTAFSIGKKALTITAGSGEKEYDGTALTDGDYSITDGSLATGDTLESVVVTGSQTVAGTSNNVPSAAVIKNGETDVTANYDITYVNGALKVTKKALTITADSTSRVYNGTALTKSTYTNTDLANGDAIDSVTVTGSQTVVGSSDNTPSAAVIKNAAGAVVTGSYDITYVKGTLEVTKKEITITADSDSKVYDGTALTKNSFTNTALGTGDTIESVTVTGSLTNVGSTENIPTSAVIKNADGVNVTSSYDITYVNGTLTVTKKAVTITADDASKTYDGTALIKNSYTNTDLAEGDEIESITVTGTQTNVGESDNVPSAAIIKNAADDDVTANYDITYVNGKLKVTAKAVTVKADNKSKAYGDEDPVFTATVTGMVDGESVSDKLTYNITRVAGENIGEYTITASGNATQGNYTVTYETGKLTITKATLTITADAQEKTYGDEDPELTYTVDGLKNGDTGDIIIGELTRVEGEDAGIYAINQGTVSAGGNYTISYTGANLTINRKAVTVKANDKTKTYGNDDPVFDATVTGMVNGEKASEKLSYTITRTDGEDVGEYTITPNGSAEQGNYSVTFETGTLTIGRRSVTATITGHNNTTVYDASEHSESGYDVSFSDDLYNAAYFMFNGTASAVRTDVGTTNMGLASSQFTNTNDNFEVTFNVTDGYQRITKATNAATVTLVDWTYGKTANELVVTADFGADTAVYTYYTDEACTSKTGTTAEEGGAAAEGEKPTQAGTYYVKAEITGTDNYAAASDSISFNINKADITITADDKSGKYKEDIVTLTWQVGGDYIEGDELGITAATTATNTSPVGEYPITLSWNENLNYKAEIVNGTYTITKTDLTVTASAYTGIYDGEEHSITVDVDGNTEAVVYYSDATELTAYNYNTIGSLTAPTRKDAGVTTVYYYVSTGNYSPDPVRGSKDITITKKSATITADNGSKVYGEADPELTAVVSGTVGGEELDFTLAREAGEDAKDYTITVTDGDNPNYDVSTVNGTFTINRADVTVAADDKSKNYGDEEPELTATITGLKRNDNENVIDYTLSRVAGENVGNYDITAIGDSTQGNYNIQFASGTLTITEKKVNTPEIKVAVGEYIYDGTDKLPEISVYDGNTLIPVDEYDVNYSDNKDAGTATVTITDKEGGNYTVNGEATFIIKKADQDAPDENTISVKNTTDETSKDGVIEGVNDSMEYSTDGGKTWKSVEEGKTSIDGLGAGEVMIRLKEDKNHNPGASVTVTVPAQGDVEVYLRKIGDAPTITVRNSKAELADKLLSDTEKDSVKAGADVDIYLTEEDITDSISDSDKKLIENALNDGEVAGLYLDVNLYKKVGNAEPVQITDTNGYSIKLGINLPDNLINKDSKVTRSYRVLRLHAGSVKEVTSSYNNSEKIVDTESDRFSIFAIIYKDVTEEKTTTEDPEKEKTTTEEPKKTTTEEPNTEEPTTEKESTPAKVTPPEKQNNENNNANTGDGTPIAVIILIMSLSLGGCAVIIRRKRKNSTE